MTDNLMSQRTADMMLLLFDDGVDQEELKALVASAFSDGVSYTVRQMDRNGEQPDD